MTRPNRLRRLSLLAAGALVLGMQGALLPPEAAASPAFDAAKSCRKQLTNQGRSYYKKRLTHLLNCVDKLLKCEVIVEVDGSSAIDEKRCRDSATTSCTSRIGPAADSAMSKAAASFDTRVGTACLLHDIANMLSTGSGGLWFANDATCNASPDVPTLVECVRERVEELADEVVAGTKPRAALLLANAGFTNYPNIPLPPTDPLVIAATAAGSGTLVNPGTVNLTQGSALEISGDGTTLPCGGSSSNGKLTLRVLSGAPEQEFELKEPYGPTRIAIFGPYTATGPISFEADLKDGSCNNTVTFTVDVVP
jgi:hypothetical protein